MTRRAAIKSSARVERLGFRLNEQTKDLIERAAQLERRKLTEFCISTLTDAARRTIEQHEVIVLSEHDRTVLFDVLVNPPAPSKRLERAFTAEQHRVARE